MIDKLAVVARFMSPAKQLFAVMSVVSLGFFVYYLVFSKTSAEGVFIPPIVFFIWSYSAWAYINMFVGVPILGDNLGFFKRLKVRFMRSFYWVVSLLFILSSLGVIFVTNKIVHVWLS